MNEGQIIQLILAVSTAGCGLLVLYMMFVRKAHYEHFVDRRKKRVETPTQMIAEGKCPSCRSEGSLLAGPSGAFSQNTACQSCMMEFNVHHSLGNGPLLVECAGRVSMERAQVFGITPAEFEAARLAPVGIVQGAKK